MLRALGVTSRWMTLGAQWGRLDESGRQSRAKLGLRRARISGEPLDHGVAVT